MHKILNNFDPLKVEQFFQHFVAKIYIYLSLKIA